MKTIFETAIGSCAISWEGKTITSFKIGVSKSHKSDVVPGWLQRIVRKVQKHLSGVAQDFSNSPLNLERIPEFHRAVYDALNKIPAGKTVSYAELAKRAGSPRAARAVGQAMAKNPFPILIPCHRVVAANGRIGNYSGGRGTATKQQLLSIEASSLS